MSKLFERPLFKYVAIIIISTFAFFLFRQLFVFIGEYIGAPDPKGMGDGFNDAEMFIKYGHPEIKSLAVQFLTLLTGILIFSLTFSEKIINYNQSTNPVRAVLIAGWTLLILAIISDGIGLAFNAIALPTALADNNEVVRNNSPNYYFYEPAFDSLKWILMSGAFFIAALLCIVTAGVASLIFQARINARTK